MANVLGRRQYSTQSTRVIPNVLKNILLVDGNINDAGFLAFFSQVPVMKTSTEQFKWDVDQWRNRTDTTSAALASTTDTTVAVSNASRYLAGELWGNKRTGEIMQVSTTNTSTGNVEFARAVTADSSGTAAANINSGDTLYFIAPAVGESNYRQPTLTTTPTEVSNYTQQFRFDLSLSRRQVKREFETEDELPFQTMKQLSEARMSLNRAFLSGEKAAYTDPSGEYTTLTVGMRKVPSTYTWAVGGTLYEYEWDDFLVTEAFRKGSRNKMMFASTAVILALSEMTKDRMEYNIPLGPKKAGVGIQVSEYHTPTGGRLLVMEDRHLTEVFDGSAVICDMTQLKRRVFSRNGYNDDLHWIMGTQDKDDLGVVNTIFGDVGLQYGIEEHHALITNVSGGAKGRAQI